MNYANERHFNVPRSQVVSKITTTRSNRVVKRKMLQFRRPEAPEVPKNRSLRRRRGVSYLQQGQGRVHQVGRRVGRRRRRRRKRRQPRGGQRQRQVRPGHRNRRRTTLHRRFDAQTNRRTHLSVLNIQKNYSKYSNFPPPTAVTFPHWSADRPRDFERPRSSQLSK